MSTIADLAHTIRSKDGDKQLSYRLGQVSSIDGLTSTPPMVTIGEGDLAYDVRITGAVWQYAVGDTVVWSERNGAPLVVGHLACTGSSLNFENTDFAPWHEVGASGEPAFQNSWVNFGGALATAAFWKQRDGWVWLKGTVKNGSSAAATIFTLPDGYRPMRTEYFSVWSGTGFATVKVKTDGVVNCSFGGSTTEVSLNEVFFPTSINYGQWTLGEVTNNWVSDSTVEDTDVTYYARDDGLIVVTGILENGSASQPVQVVPEGARIGRNKQVFACNGSSLTRLDLGGVDTPSHLFQMTANNTLIYTGGIKYYGQLGRAINWDPFPYATGWTTYDATLELAIYENLHVHKDHHGVVWLRGLAARTGGTSLVGTLPAGFRPAATRRYHAVGDSNIAIPVDIGVNGNVTSTSAVAGWTSFSGIGFRATQ